ncbi:hypothetical protein [Brevibacterium sp.]|uniref:hypothetical protein n=1 Tax=Brevibacterium sp. TaxID=1701 RepID=UPI0028126D47|nr:hypothetical protein [Brevibacterium sp.]
MPDHHEEGDTKAQDGGATVRSHGPGTSGRGADSVEGALQPSQALPLITEELAAAYTTTRTAPEPPRTDRFRSANQAVHPHAYDTAVRNHTAVRNDTAVRNNTAFHGDTPAGRVDVADDAREHAGSDNQDAEDGKKSKKGEGGLSITQLLAGAGAAATSSVIGGQLGVAGTVMGAAAASIITAVAVTIYSKSIDKGKEKVKDVGSKLAPAVKVAPANITDGKPLVSLMRGATFRKHSREANADGRSTGQPAPGLAASAFGSAPADGVGHPTADAIGTAATAAADAPDGTAYATGTAEEEEQEPRTWLQKLRRKRVLYPVAIGVATFGVGLGIVVAAESFTDADISPGTSQISRSVTGSTAEDPSDSQDSGGSSGSGTTSGEDGSRVVRDPVEQQGPEGTDSSSASAGESGASGGKPDTSQGTDTGTTTSDGTTSDAASTDADSSTSTSGGTSDSGSQTGTTDGSSSSGSSSTSGTSGSGSTSSGGSGSVSGSGSSSSGSGSAGSSSGSVAGSE